MRVASKMLTFVHMEQTTNQTNKTKFVCPVDGEISNDDVAFLCNHCKQEEVILQDGLYLCPGCLMPGENFECMICGSKEVKMVKS